MSRNRTPRPRGAHIYDTPALSHGDLVQRMMDRGLRITDRQRAERYLRHVGYYRLSPYMIPFQVSDGSHTFDHGTTFDAVLGLYVFDRKLRLLVLDALERIEVAIRAAITDTMALQAGPFWYEDRVRFTDGAQHSALLALVRETAEAQLRRRPETERSRLAYPSALEHYLRRYGQPDLPPSWIMIESLTIGQLERLYDNLADRADRKAIAECVGTNEILLRSWLRTYVRVRNICAHHGRLWNVGLGVYLRIPTSPRIAWPHATGTVADTQQKRLYPVLVSLQSVLHTVSPRSTWGHRLSQLLADNPSVPLRAMGFPENWDQDRFWRGSTAR